MLWLVDHSKTNDFISQCPAIKKKKKDNRVYADDFNNLVFKRLEAWKPESNIILHIVSIAVIHLSLVQR